MRIRRAGLIGLVSLSVVAAGCGSNNDTQTAGDQKPATSKAPATSAPTTKPPATTAGTAKPPTTTPGAMALTAPKVSTIVVDGDAKDWADVPAMDLKLQPIKDEASEAKDAVVKVAHDGNKAYVLFQVKDDYKWAEGGDLHKTSAEAVEWGIDKASGEAMGATDDSREKSLGTVDIWHWELQCAAGKVSGGTTSAGPAEGKGPGSDGSCKLDDEFATTPKERKKDEGPGAENSLSGVWSHSNPTAGAAGTWTFEMSRPMDTKDAKDAAFTVGGTARMAVAYWDPDVDAAKGWDDDQHVQSTKNGWITVTFAA